MAEPIFQIQFETLDFGLTPRTIQYSVPSILEPSIIPDRFGSVVTSPPVLGPRSVTIAGIIQGSTKEAVREQTDDFMRVLGEGTRGRLFFYSDRFLNCYVEQDIQLDPIPGSAGLAWSYLVRFHGDDPFFYATSSFIHTEIVGAGNNDGIVDPTNLVYRKDITIVNAGNAFVYPIIHVKADQGVDLDQATRLIHVGNNLTVTYNGTISQTTTAKFDLANFDVQNPTGVANRDMNNVPETTRFWWLERGSQVFRFEGRASTVAIFFTPRYFFV